MTQQQQQTPGEPARHAPTVLDPTVAPPAPPPQRVHVIAGADVQDMDLAGRRVGDARAVVQALFGVHPNAVALIGGRRVADDQALGEGQTLEFVKHAGQKGAGAPAPASRGVPTIELTDERAVWWRNGREIMSRPVGELFRRVAATGSGPRGWRMYPPHVRVMAERAGGSVTGVVIEMPPEARIVRWIADGSPEEYGPGTRYDARRLSFPWVVLLMVFANGEITGLQQAFFRTAPLGSLDDDLYFTCLLNTANARPYHGQESWVCFQNMTSSLENLAWNERVKAVTDHFWHAAFNRSSEAHEGNSYWGTAREIDPRLATAAAWEAATRTDPYFTLRVAWRRAPRPVGATLERMLDSIAPWRPVESVEQVVTLMQEEG